MLKYRKLQGIQKYLGKISVQCSAVTQLCLTVTPWTAGHQASLSITNSWSSLKLVFIESVMPSNRFILCCSLLLWPSVFPSIRVFSNESVLCTRWPKYELQLQHQWMSASPFSDYLGLISFRMAWLDLLAVQGTLQSLLQHYSSKASILRCLSILSGPTLTSIHGYLWTRAR